MILSRIRLHGPENGVGRGRGFGKTRYMPARPSPSVRRPPYVSLVLVIGCFALVGAGLAFAATCNGGYSLIFFGGAVALLGAMLYRTGAWATIIPFAIIVLTLVGGGWYGGSVAGCWP